MLLDLPYFKLEAVVVFGNVQITTQAMIELLNSGIPLGLLSRSGVPRGSLEPARGKNIPLRLAQFRMQADGEQCLSLARRLVAAKLANAASVLASFGDRELARGGAVQAAVGNLTTARAKLGDCVSLEAVHGVEGAAARLYFETLMLRNKSTFAWPGRVKHPATDPINALLSFGYTLVANEIAGLLEGVGLDSYLGVLHQLDYGRRSLAYDLIEPFRAPLVDRMVLTLLNRKQFNAADFESQAPDGQAGAAGLCLRPEACKRFLAEYESWMARAPMARGGGSFRRSLREQVDSWARQFRADSSGRNFVPFQFGADSGQTDDPGAKCDT